MPDPNSRKQAALNAAQVLAEISAGLGQSVADYLQDAGPDGLAELCQAIPDGFIAPLTVQVSPQLASVLLAAMSPDNRKPVTRNVEQHVRAVAEDRWKLTGEGLKVSRDGVTVDGEHRLTGWVQAMTEGAPWPRTMLFLGVPADAVEEMDGGRKRSLYQQAAMAGWHHPQGSLVLSAASRLWQWTEHGWALASGGTAKVPTVTEVTAFTEAHPDLGDLSRHVRAMLPPGFTPVSWLLVRWLASQQDPEAAADFAEQWVTSAGLAPGHPLLALRNRALRRTSVDIKRDNADEQLYLGLKAWNAWCAGETVAKFQLPRYGLTNDTFTRMKIATPSSDRWRSNLGE